MIMFEKLRIHTYIVLYEYFSGNDALLIWMPIRLKYDFNNISIIHTYIYLLLYIINSLGVGKLKKIAGGLQ